MVPDPSIGSGNTGDAGNGPILGGHITSLKGGPGPSLFWSDVTVPGRPRVLILDAVEDRAGWEATATMRIAESLIRRGISVIGDAVVPVSGSDDITLALRSPRDFNCIFLTVRADNSTSMSEYWIALQDGLAGESKLFAMCTWDTADPKVAEDAIKVEDTFAPIAVVQQQPMSGRGASLFFMKFFAELDMHSESTNSMTGKMVWFGHSKAREIMRRRHYDGRVGLRS